ncbi:hypothetical protein E4K67_02885 [Desulfosporosinus fructosivorans]|uniref:Uncharacterized protein n=1 Tax=Desulfosporosinus fructosivorans TaxID=2018669 RepID=A0A4Z0R9Q7_9FIRM|nr:hypothetical protein [Desulfosporosinus fructosivorans]TGE39941.1 hypothetical protein E4K67_02885 [Desulfosporosinus fructosivorans]
MAFTLIDAATLWDKLQQNRPSTTPLSVLKNDMAMALEDYKPNDVLEQTLRDIFERAGMAYPEKVHVFHIKTTLITALSQLAGQ